MDRAHVDLERFLRSVVEIRNETGGHGYDSGIRTFDCPICHESKGRGWVGVEGWGAGCWNVGCVAEPRLEGGAVEWARRVLGKASRAEAWRELVVNFSSAAPVRRAPTAPAWADWCRLPAYTRSFMLGGTQSPLQWGFERFVREQWGIDVLTAMNWGLGWCLSGLHAWRVVIPVLASSGVCVGFQSRTINDAEPKYLTSRHGVEADPSAECGRPASAMLFNAGAIRRGEDIVLVEGAGDVMGWHRRDRARCPAAVALLGVALTPEKLATIEAGAPSRVIVALDAQPEASRRGLAHVEDLRAWGVAAVTGRWVGGKDAGSGAQLVTTMDSATLVEAARGRLGS